MSDIRYLSSRKAAEVLRITTRRVTGLCQEGKLKGAIMNGRGWRIPEQSVYELAEHSSFSQGKLPCSVGNTSYADVVSNSYYVDKTLLIRDLIDDQIPTVLFTRPRRFGKTLTMDMLKTFFEISDEDTSVYFRNKKIWMCGEKYQQLQGSFPVVSITFKDAGFLSWEETFSALKNIIRAEFIRHEELFLSSCLNPLQQDYLKRMQCGDLGDVEYSRALLELVRMLERHHHSRVIVLIDEYDTPIQQGHIRGYYDHVITFMRNFLSAGLKDNTAVQLGVLTGILRVSKENLFSGMNHIVVNTVLDDKYNSYFGFTQEEVEDMVRYYGCDDRLMEIRDWYDGYRFGNRDIYNPWSVSNYFFHECKAKPYWTNTCDNAVIREIMASLTPDISESMLTFMEGNTVMTSLQMDVIYPAITEGKDTIFSFLLLAGYLKPVHDPIETESGTFAELALPNKEVKRAYNTEILFWLKKKIGNNVMNDLEKALLMGDNQALQKTLQNYMISCISYFDSSNEDFFHGMMLGLSAGMSSQYHIRSNRESGTGRFDLVLEPKSSHLPGIIMEFKAVKDSSFLDAAAQEALNQIRTRRYDVELVSRGITEIDIYGIAFAGKDVRIQHE